MPVRESESTAPSGICTHPLHCRDDILTLDARDRLALSVRNLYTEGVCDLQLAKSQCGKGRSIRSMFVSIQLVCPRDFGRDIEHPDMGFISDPTWGIYPQKARIKAQPKRPEGVLHAPWGATEEAGGAATLQGAGQREGRNTGEQRSARETAPNDYTLQQSTRTGRNRHTPFESQSGAKLLGVGDLRKRLHIKASVIAGTNGEAPKASATTGGASALAPGGNADTSTKAKAAVRGGGLFGKGNVARSTGDNKDGSNKPRKTLPSTRPPDRRSARVIGSGANTASTKKCKPNREHIGKLWPFVSEEGRLLERHDLPHQSLLRMFPNTLVPVSAQTEVTAESRAVVADLFEGAAALPDWVLSGYAAMDNLYRGANHYYVWYPLNLAKRPLRDQSTQYTLYIGLVNRIDVLERLLQDTRLAQRTRRALVMFQDMHHMLCLFITMYGVFSDQELLMPAVFSTQELVHEPLSWELVLQRRAARVLLRQKSESTLDHAFAVRETVSARSNVWAQQQQTAADSETLNSVPDEMRRFRKDCEHLFAHRASEHDGSFVDVFYPSYEFVFHEGELPDLSPIVRYSGLFGDENLNDIPFEDADMLSLRNLIAKSLPLPMRPREIDAIASEKCEENELVKSCLERMTFATLGGYYSQSAPTSFYTRSFLYRWFQFCPPYLDQLCAWLSGHKRLALDGETEIDVIHKELVLHVVKEYLVNIVYQMPDLSAQLSTYFWFDEMAFEMHEALETMRQTVDDVFYGSGPRWLRFERRYFKYVSTYENMRISHNLKPRLGELWNSRNKEVCKKREVAKNAERLYAQQQHSATITRNKVLPGYINMYPERKRRKRVREEKQHLFSSALRALYQETLDALPIEHASSQADPRVLFAHLRPPVFEEVPYRDDPATPGSEASTSSAADSQIEDLDEHDMENIESVYDIMMKKLYRAKNKQSVAQRNRTFDPQIKLVLPVALCNSILRILVDPISNREDLAHLKRETLEPLADILDITIEWLGRTNDETWSVGDLLWEVVQGTRRWESIQYALRFKLQYRSTDFKSYDPEVETPDEYRARWQQTTDELAERLTDRGLKIVHAALSRDASARQASADGAYSTWSEETRRAMIQRFLKVYTGDRNDPVNEDHRSVFSQLHGISLVWNAKDRCTCPQCMDTAQFSDRFLYEEFQQTVCGHEAANIVFQSHTMNLCNAILRDVYENKTIKYLYRTTSQPFVQHLVEQMWMAAELYKDNTAFRAALAAITDDELQFITAVVSRLPRWEPISMEWMACRPLLLHWSPIAVLHWSRVMYESNTYTIDLRSSVREMIVVFPREFILIQHMFNEVHARRRIVLYKLPLATAQQQYDTACKKFGINSERGDPIPPIVSEYYYCPAHGDVKRPLARQDTRVTMSFGHTGVAYNVDTNAFECTQTKHRSKAKARGSVHTMRKLHANLRFLTAMFEQQRQRQCERDQRETPRDLNDAWQPALDALVDVSEVVQRAGLTDDTAALDLVSTWLVQQRAMLSKLKNDSQMPAAAQELCRSLSTSKAGKAVMAWLWSARDPVRFPPPKKRRGATRGCSRASTRKGLSNEEDYHMGAGQMESSKAMLRNMADLQCGGPLPKVNLMGRLLALNGNLYMLCPYCLTLMLFTRDSHSEFGISCNLCMSTLKSLCPRKLSEFVRVSCFECGDSAPLERPENTYMYILLDDTQIGRRAQRAIYLCRKHYKVSLCKTGEVMGLTAARKYMKMEVKRVRIGSDPHNPEYVLIDMAENNNVMPHTPRHQIGRGVTPTQRGYFVWSHKEKRMQYRIKSGEDIPTDVTQRAVEVVIDPAIMRGVTSQRRLLQEIGMPQTAAPDSSASTSAEAGDSGAARGSTQKGRKRPQARRMAANKIVIDWSSMSHSPWSVSMHTPGVANSFYHINRLTRQATRSAQRRSSRGRKSSVCVRGRSGRDVSKHTADDQRACAQPVEKISDAPSMVTKLIPPRPSVEQ